jgi:hypothetical protein
MTSRRFALIRLCAHCGTFACDSLETRFDICYGAAGTARLTLQEENTSVLLQDGFRRSTCVAGDVLFDVSKINANVKAYHDESIEDVLTFSEHSQFV